MRRSAAREARSRLRAHLAVDRHRSQAYGKRIARPTPRFEASLGRRTCRARWARSSSLRDAAGRGGPARGQRPRTSAGGRGRLAQSTTGQAEAGAGRRRRDAGGPLGRIASFQNARGSVPEPPSGRRRLLSWPPSGTSCCASARPPTGAGAAEPEAHHRGSPLCTLGGGRRGRPSRKRAPRRSLTRGPVQTGFRPAGTSVFARGDGPHPFRVRRACALLEPGGLDVQGVVAAPSTPTRPRARGGSVHGRCPSHASARRRPGPARHPPPQESGAGRGAAWPPRAPRPTADRCARWRPRSRKPRACSPTSTG
jgi:hypothetical protein